MGQKIKRFVDLDAWKEAHKLVIEVYNLTKAFPNKELFGLISQLQRAVVSITTNIAEGFSRYYFKDRIRFYYNARGSISEVQNLLIVARDVGYIDNKKLKDLLEKTERVTAIINGLINSTHKLAKK